MASTVEDTQPVYCIEHGTRFNDRFYCQICGCALIELAVFLCGECDTMFDEYMDAEECCPE